MKTAHYDLVIVGGGMVGATLACALGDTELSIALIEHQKPVTTWPATGFDCRVSAITRASEKVFRTVGAWPGMTERRVCPYQAMQVWDAGGDGTIQFDCAEIAEPNLGHIIENRVIQAALWQRSASFVNIKRQCPATPAAVEWQEDHARLTLESGKNLTANLLVAADGGRSWLREQAAIESIGRDYRQSAVVATVRAGSGHRATAWQRFLPEGPLALLPLPEDHCAVVWSTTTEQAGHLLTLSDEAFLEALQDAFGNDLGSLEEPGPRGSFPLRLAHSREYVRPRLALVGDAAHTIHPLAGQGVNLGLADAACLAQVILEAHRQDRDIGSMAVLRRYERWRKGENLAMMAAMDGFQRLFGNEQMLLAKVRNLGLNLTDRLPLVKNILMRRALGLSGDLPDLARGVERL